MVGRTADYGWKRGTASVARGSAREPHRRHIGIAGIIISAILVGVRQAGAENGEPRPIPIAVADLDYSDSSGEVKDQSEKHAALVQDFVERLRADLATSDKYRVVVLRCGSGPCTAKRSDPNVLLGLARDAGALLLLYGRIHKMSTLVQWAKVQIVDVRADRLVFDRLLSFRGDDERAWQRAEAFLATDLARHDLSDELARDTASSTGHREHKP